jgi:hypothetical protein
MDTSAASLTAASMDSSSSIWDRSLSLNLFRYPHVRTSFEYWALSPTILWSSDYVGDGSSGCEHEEEEEEDDGERG